MFTCQVRLAITTDCGLSTKCAYKGEWQRKLAEIWQEENFSFFPQRWKKQNQADIMTLCCHIHKGNGNFSEYVQARRERLAAPEDSPPKNLRKPGIVIGQMPETPVLVIGTAAQQGHDDVSLCDTGTHSEPGRKTDQNKMDSLYSK